MRDARAVTDRVIRETNEADHHMRCAHVAFQGWKAVGEEMGGKSL